MGRKRAFVGRAAAIGAIATTALVLQTGVSEAAGYCDWTEYTYKVTFHCHATSTSYSVCIASAEFAYYRENPVTVHSGSFGGSVTLSSGSRYLVKGSEWCSAS